MKSYLQTADNFIRSYLLTAILVAANQQSGQVSTIGKKLAIVCEHMGPAHVKLAQLVHSHPSTSAEVRADLAHVKGKANPPHRWSLWRQMAEVLSKADLAKIKRVGRLIGSASYNLALEVMLQTGETVVLLMLRENAETSARKGFAHIRATIQDCEHPTVVNQRLVMSQIIDEAARLSESEMNRQASESQAKLAEKLYTQTMRLSVAGQPVQVTVTPTTILSSGNGYRFITMMHGEEFNVLPDALPQQRFLKHVVAKAVVTMELHNILRGGQFDSDRHGNQLRVRVLNEAGANLHIQLGLYDFGEMALELPTAQGLYQLADVITGTALYQSFDTTIDQHIAARIDHAVKRGESTNYLMRLRKAFLALHDFKHYLQQEDLADIFNTIAAKNDIHPVLHPPLQRSAFVFNNLLSLSRATTNVSQFFSRFSVFKSSVPALPDPQLLSPPKSKGNFS